MSDLSIALHAPNSSLHGVSLANEAHTELQQRLEELRLRGFTLLPSGLQNEELALLRTSLEAIYTHQVQAMGGEQALRRCHDLHTARCPLAHDDAFVRLASSAPLMELARALLGPQVVLMQQNGLLNRPDTEHYQVHWHRDLAYQHWVSSEPLAFNALLALDEFTVENGATWVLPGSHLRPEFPSSTFINRHAVPVEAKAGSFLVLDAMLYHRAGRNLSSGQRRAVNHLIGRPFMAQQMDLPHLLGGRFAQDPLLGPYLGYRWAPRKSVEQWRHERMR